MIVSGKMSEQITAAIDQRTAIAAIATPVGEGGIAVIRVSGREAIEKVRRCFTGKELTVQPSHTVHFGRVVGSDGETVDEVLATLSRSPASYTGEGTAETDRHGGGLDTRAARGAI